MLTKSGVFMISSSMTPLESLLLGSYRFHAKASEKIFNKKYKKN